MLLDPAPWSLAQASDEVLAQLSDKALSTHLAGDTHRGGGGGRRPS